jgi:phage shock protein A
MTEAKNKNRLIIPLLILLLLSIGYNFYQRNNHTTTVVAYDSKIDTMINARVELERELSSLEVELEKYRGISSNLDSLLNDANEDIAQQEKRIRAMLAKETDNKKLIAKLNSELAELKSLREDYIERIDQLITENNMLKVQNEELNTSIQNLNDERKSLMNKVQVASQLTAEYIKVNSFKKKSSGKYTETSIAKRTNKLEVCFTIMDNKVAPTGDKKMYIVITEPTGKILAGYSKAEFTSVNNEQVSASASSLVNYDGQKQNVCLSYENDERILTPGTYTIDIFIDGTFVANTAYLLK